jgi:PAS domain S-box-containing protein
MKTKPTYQELENENKKLRNQLLNKASEDKFCSIFSTISNVAVQGYDKNRKVIYWNKASEILYGYTQEEAINKKLEELIIRPEMRETVITDVDKWHKNNIKTSNGELVLMKKDKSLVTVYSSHVMIEKSDGEKEMFCVDVDITERKQAEKTLKASEEKYRHLTETMKDVIVRTSIAGKILYVSPSIEEFAGYKPEEEIGNHISQYFARKKDLLRAIKLISKTHITKKSGTFEFIFKSKGAKAFWVELTYVPLIKMGKVYAVQMALRDVRERKEIERALVERENRLKAFYEISYEAIFFSENGICVEANQQASELFGYSYNEFIGMFGTEIVAPESKELITQHILSGYEKPYDAIARKKDGTMFYGEFHGKMYNYKGKKVRVTAIRDISERKKAEETLKKSEEKLRESNNTKDKFFAIIAHDLRSPFNSMLGFSDILLKDFDNYTTEEKKKFIGIINQQLNKTFNLIENLLLWSRIHSETIDFSPELLNLYSLSNETLSLLNQSAKNKSIELIIEIDENLDIEADKYMLSTIIRNLISNAIKFTDKGGKVSIDTNRMRNEQKEEFVEITITDNGVGIPKEIQSKLFDIGESTSAPGTENESGTGLGLILCKEFVEKHGGKIWLESEIEKGSKFCFTIPYYS